MNIVVHPTYIRGGTSVVVLRQLSDRRGRPGRAAAPFPGSHYRARVNRASPERHGERQPPRNTPLLVNAAAFCRRFARKNPQLRHSEVTSPVRYAPAGEFARTVMEDAMPHIRIVATGTFVLPLLAAAIADAAAAQCATHRAAGKPLPLLQFFHHKSTTKPPAHPRLAARLERKTVVRRRIVTRASPPAQSRSRHAGPRRNRRAADALPDNMWPSRRTPRRPADMRGSCQPSGVGRRRSTESVVETRSRTRSCPAATPCRSALPIGPTQPILPPTITSKEAANREQPRASGRRRRAGGACLGRKRWRG